MRWRDVALAVATAIQAGACQRSSGSEQTAGRVTVDWTGSDTGRMVARARAEWCDSLGLLEIRAMRGDTGLAIAVYPVAAPPRPDSYPVQRPRAVRTKPPTSAIAMRWFAETAIRGFQGEQGAVILDRVNGRVSGRFQAAMRSVTDTTRVVVAGSFDDVRVVAATRGCGSRPRAGDAGAGVH